MSPHGAGTWGLADHLPDPARARTPHAPNGAAAKPDAALRLRGLHAKHAGDDAARRRGRLRRKQDSARVEEAPRPGHTGAVDVRRPCPVVLPRDEVVRPVERARRMLLHPAVRRDRDARGIEHVARCPDTGPVDRAAAEALILPGDEVARAIGGDGGLGDPLCWTGDLEAARIEHCTLFRDAGSANRDLPTRRVPAPDDQVVRAVERDGRRRIVLWW